MMYICMTMSTGETVEQPVRLMGDGGGWGGGVVHNLRGYLAIAPQ